MATVTEQVKETLLGTTVEPQLSPQSKSEFDRYAQGKDENDEPFMSEDDFIRAIAPETEDYVGGFWRPTSKHFADSQ